MTLKDFAPHPALAVLTGLMFAGGWATSCNGPAAKERHTAWLATVKSEVVSVSPDKLDPKNEGRWVYFVSDVSGCEDVLIDAEYGVARRCYFLKRHMQVYRTDGGEDGPSDNWCGSELNDPPQYRTQVWRVPNPMLGEYALSSQALHELWASIGGVDGVPKPPESASIYIDWDKRFARQMEERWPLMPLTDPVPTGWQPMGNGTHWFLGADPARPKHLDKRISYSCAQFPNRNVTVLAKHQGGTLVGDPESSGDRPFTCIRPGRLTLDELFAEAERENDKYSEQRRVGGRIIALAGVVLFIFGSIVAGYCRRHGIVPPSEARTPNSEM